MKLRIEDGILLKPYALAWTTEGWGKRPVGWTPDDTNEWVRERADELLAQTTSKDNLVLPRIFALKAAADDYGKELYEQHKPWPGWVPIVASFDRNIARAYRRLFIEMNPNVDNPTVPIARKHAVYPPDGWYELRGSKMNPLQEVDNVGNKGE